MTLDEYLTDRKLDSAAFAATIGTSRQNVSRWRRFGRVPSPDMMRRIFRATHGRVAPNDFFDLRLPKSADAAGGVVHNQNEVTGPG